MFFDTGKYLEVLQEIVGGLSHNPIQIIPDEMSLTRVHYLLRVPASDIGLVSGYQANVMKAIQQVFRIIAVKEGMEKVQVSYDVVGERDRSQTYRTRKEWNDEKAESYVHNLVGAVTKEIFSIDFQSRGSLVAVHVYPELHSEIHKPVNTILEQYGYAHGRKFGLAHQKEVSV